MDPNQEVDEIKREISGRLQNATHVWIIEDNKGIFTVHEWCGSDYKFGAGVAPQHEYPTLRKAAARFLQLLGCGPVAPQTWPERVCVSMINTEEEA